jgi:hypothetical protein
VGGRHPDVDDHEVGLVLADKVEQLGRVTCLSDHLEIRPREQTRKTLAQENVVLRDGDSVARARGRLDRAGTLRAAWLREE